MLDSSAGMRTLLLETQKLIVFYGDCIDVNDSVNLNTASRAEVAILRDKIAKRPGLLAENIAAFRPLRE